MMSVDSISNVLHSGTISYTMIKFKTSPVLVYCCFVVRPKSLNNDHNRSFYDRATFDISHRTTVVCSLVVCQELRTQLM